jgi:hypothetical protein
MKASSLSDGRWSSVLARLSAVADLDATAREFGAFQRRGQVSNPEGVLRLALMYGPGGLSLRGTAAAAEGLVGSLSDKAVEGRLRKAGAWLEHLLECLLRARLEQLPSGGLALVDGSVIKPPGKGPQWRLHARYDPGRGRFVDLKLSPITTSEKVAHTAPSAGQTVITDRGYARVRDIATVLAQRADFITRIGWRSLRLLTADGSTFDLISALSDGNEAAEHAVWLKGVDRPLRLVLQRLPEDKISRAGKRALRKSAKNRTKVDPRTLKAAHYLMLLTSLPADQQGTAHVIELYRTRWQVELGFKRLKTLSGIDALPSADPRLARTWLLAHLIVAVLTEDLTEEILGIPPSKADATVSLTLEGLAMGA